MVTYLMPIINHEKLSGNQRFRENSQRTSENKTKWLATCNKVNKYTRAGKDGKFIICPICEQGSYVFHFLGQHSVVSIVIVLSQRRV